MASRLKAIAGRGKRTRTHLMPLHLLRMSRRRAGLLTLVAGMLGLPVSVDAQSYELLHSFAGSDGDPALPEGSLIQARDGRLYGTSAAGGTYGDGTVFRMSLNGGIEVMHSFQQTRDGAFPLANVIQGTDGDFYGTLGFVGCAVLCQPMTLRQTEMNPSLASEFRMTPEGVVRALSSHYGERVAFSALFPLRAPFLQASNG